jgi:pre-mRNA-splicing factor SYF1
MQYLDLRVKHVSQLNPAKYAEEYNKVNDCFERSLILLNKMPRIWLDYLSFLLKQCLIGKTRRAFDRALRALPLTQHSRIWELYLPFANSASGETAVRIWRRYMQVHPEDAEEFIELLVSQGKYEEAAEKWIEILDNPRFKSKEGKSHFQMWSELCDLLVTHAREIKSVDVEKIVRSGISKFSDQRGKLWTSLGTYWITKGDFERVSIIYHIQSRFHQLTKVGTRCIRRRSHDRHDRSRLYPNLRLLHGIRRVRNQHLNGSRSSTPGEGQD